MLMGIFAFCFDSGNKVGSRKNARNGFKELNTSTTFFITINSPEQTEGSEHRKSGDALGEQFDKRERHNEEVKTVPTILVGEDKM